MKRSRIGTIGIILSALLCSATSALASQGFYGYAYSHATIDYLGLHIQANTRNIANALIYVYNSGGQYVVSTTASGCGYYTVDVSSGGYYTVQVVQKYYYERQLNTCSSTNEYENLTGQRGWYLVSGFWTQLDLATN